MICSNPTPSQNTTTQLLPCAMALCHAQWCTTSTFTTTIKSKRLDVYVQRTAVRSINYRWRAITPKHKFAALISICYERIKSYRRSLFRHIINRTATPTTIVYKQLSKTRFLLQSCSSSSYPSMFNPKTYPICCWLLNWPPICGCRNASGVWSVLLDIIFWSSAPPIPPCIGWWPLGMPACPGCPPMLL